MASWYNKRSSQHKILFAILLSSLELLFVIVKGGTLEFSLAKSVVGRAENGAETGSRDIGIDTDTPEPTLSLVFGVRLGRNDLDIRSSLDVGASTDSVFRILSDGQVDTQARIEGIQEGRQGTVTGTADVSNHTVDRHLCRKRSLTIRSRFGVGWCRCAVGGAVAESERAKHDSAIELRTANVVFRAQGIGDVLHGKLSTGGLGDGLNNLVEGDLHASREIESERLLDDVGDSD